MRRLASIFLVTATVAIAYGEPRRPESPPAQSEDGFGSHVDIQSTAGVDTSWYGGTVWAPDSNRWEAIPDGIWTFQSGVGSAIQNRTPESGKPNGYHRLMEGWTGFSLNSDSDVEFRRSTSCVISGSHSMWAGKTQAEAEAACWPGGSGYGNGMAAILEQTFVYSGSGDVGLQFDYAVDAEPGFDDLTVSVRPSDAGSDVVLGAWDGVVSGAASFTLRIVDGTLPAGAGTVTICFIAASDGSYSDEDGLHTTTCGLAAVDDIQLTGAITHSADFETSDDGWTVPVPSPVVDDFSSLARVDDLPPPSGFSGRCGAIDSVLVFVDPSGQHPAGQSNIAASPWIDLKAGGDVGRPNLMVSFDAYSGTNTPATPNLSFGAQYYPWTCSVTGEVGISPVTLNSFFFYFGAPSCGPVTYHLNSLAPPGAEQVRVFIGPHWFQTANSDAGPWFDNIRVGVYDEPTSGVSGVTPPMPRFLSVKPNPLLTTTRIRFTVPVKGAATLAVHDVAGRQIRTLLEATLPAGSHEATWDGRDHAGRRVASGLYFLRLTSGGGTTPGRVVVAR